jgi:hypothetical protein
LIIWESGILNDLKFQGWRGRVNGVTVEINAVLGQPGCGHAHLHRW